MSRWIVIKLGGELAIDPRRLAETVGAAVKALLADGARVAIVHGGGSQATSLSQRLGLQTRQVLGQRVTDEATLEVMKLAVAGQTAVDVASAFRLAGVPALCTSGVSAGLVDARRRPPVRVEGQAEPVDMGLVGDVVAVNTVLLSALAQAGVVPVLSCLAGDAQGHVFNVNADTVATRIAAALKASALVLVSTVPGVLKDRNDPSTRIARLTRRLAEQSIANGSIVGGMIPKVQESLAMLDEGVAAIHIVGDSGILEELRTPGSRGTVFVRE